MGKSTSGGTWNEVRLRRVNIMDQLRHTETNILRPDPSHLSYILDSNGYTSIRIYNPSVTVKVFFSFIRQYLRRNGKSIGELWLGYQGIRQKKKRISLYLYLRRPEFRTLSVTKIDSKKHSFPGSPESFSQFLVFE